MSASSPDVDVPAPAGLAGLLSRWLPRQRWFAHKGSGDVDVAVVAQFALPGASGVDARILLVEAAGATYQVPLVLAAPTQPVPDAALVGALPDGTNVLDGPRDSRFVAAWLRLFGGDHAQVTGRRPAAALPIDPDAPSRVLSGEQSNTSVIVGADGPNPLIVKLFRVLAAGPNPDVVVQTALAGAGCLRVARPAGWLEGGLDAFDGATAHLAYACEFLPGSEDAWRVATRAVAGGVPFAREAADLGAATAEVHAVLARALPTSPAGPEVLGRLADGLLDRVDWAVANAPLLAPFAGAARQVVDGVRTVRDVAPLQQVHGDYHLGQVLHAPGRGWVLLDFEGEPLRPLAERTAPDLPVRDVAGMLRSFDYAARAATVGLDPADRACLAAQDWATQAREAFLAGYTQEWGTDPRADGVLLRALELDKALYEVVYEVRNRPDWVSIPLAAVQRLLRG